MCQMKLNKTCKQNGVLLRAMTWKNLKDPDTIWPAALQIKVYIHGSS